MNPKSLELLASQHDVERLTAVTSRRTGLRAAVRSIGRLKRLPA